MIRTTHVSYWCVILRVLVRLIPLRRDESVNVIKHLLIVAGRLIHVPIHLRGEPPVFGYTIIMVLAGAVLQLWRLRRIHLNQVPAIVSVEVTR